MKCSRFVPIAALLALVLVPPASAEPPEGPRQLQLPVSNALSWLAAHQSPTGAWEAAGFGRWCNLEPAEKVPVGAGKAVHDVGVTGLALNAFLGVGITGEGEHKFDPTVMRGLAYLLGVQDREGLFGARETMHWVYNHAYATLAMVEAYRRCGTETYRLSAQKALDLICKARNPYFAWRYGIKPGDNDTSVTTAMTLALNAAWRTNQEAQAAENSPPLRIDEEAFDGVRAWLEKILDPDYGRYGYIQRGGASARPQALIDRFPADLVETTTAMGMVCWSITQKPGPPRGRIFSRAPSGLEKGAELLTKALPEWDPNGGTIDMIYWWYGTLAMKKVGGMSWRKWARALERAVRNNQRKDTTYCLYKGSWDPIGPWGPDGGRVYATAVLCMALEVYYGYEGVAGL